MSDFDQVTLHELGHAVDDKLTFMGKRKLKPKYGGWDKHKIEAVVDVAGVERGFYARWEDQYPRAMLKVFLKTALTGAVEKGPWVYEKGKADGAPGRQALLDDAGVKEAETKRAELDGAGWDSNKADDLCNRIRPAIKNRMGRIVAREVIEKMLIGNVKAADAIDSVLSHYAAAVDPPPEQVWQQMGEGRGDPVVPGHEGPGSGATVRARRRSSP